MVRVVRVVLIFGERCASFMQEFAHIPKFNSCQCLASV